MTFRYLLGVINMNNLRKAMLGAGLAGVIGGVGVMSYQMYQKNELRSDERVEEVLDMRNIANHAGEKDPSSSVDRVYDFTTIQAKELEQTPEVKRKLGEYETHKALGGCGILLMVAGLASAGISYAAGTGYQSK